MNIPWRWLVFLWAGFASLAHGASADGLQSMEFTVDGVTRTALVYVPPGATGASLPLVFVFHGHGGTSHNALNKFALNREWPGAISVYPQGLNTPGKLTDPEGKVPGWQKAEGEQGDRDLHFFDALLARLKKEYPVDASRIYCTGHSNGGGFTYLLWKARPQVFVAVAPCSGASRDVLQVPPKPAMILAGRADELVKFETQEKMIAAVRRVNGCAGSGEPWQGVGTLYPSASGTPLVTFVYPGGHAMDPAEPALIVKFFQEHRGQVEATKPPAS